MLLGLLQIQESVVYENLTVAVVQSVLGRPQNSGHFVIKLILICAGKYYSGLTTIS
jgi:hypothetical protein